MAQRRYQRVSSEQRAMQAQQGFAHLLLNQRDVWWFGHGSFRGGRSCHAVFATGRLLPTRTDNPNFSTPDENAPEAASPKAGTTTYTPG